MPHLSANPFSKYNHNEVMNLIQNLNKTLAKIQELLNERNWTLYRLSKASGITYSSLNSMFNKNTQPTIYTLEKICVSLDITLADFFKNENTMPKESFTAAEKEYIGDFRKLDKTDQELLQKLCKKLLSASEKTN